MKKLLLSALAVCAFTFVNAQEETTSTEGSMSKGDILISGTAGFGSTSNVAGVKDNSENSFNFSPRATYLVSDNIGVGLKVGFGSNKAENAVTETMDVQTLTLGAFGRYFFTPASKFSVFGELGFDYNSWDNKLAIVDGKSNGFDVAVGPGICYFVSKNFAIEASWGALGYETMKNEADGAESQDDFGLNLDLADLNFGLAYKF